MNWRKLHGDCFEGARVLITGGAGFIGSHLAEALVSLGASVVVLDDLSGGQRENLASFGPVEFVQGSILDCDLLDHCTRGCRWVLHQAALGSVPGSVEQPRVYQEVNTTGTLNVLEAARKAGVHRVMFAASSSAYGDNPVPWTESMPVMPKSPYAATKVAGEALMKAYSASYGLDTACLRYFNIFGPRQNANSAYAAVIAAFAKALFAGVAPVIFGDGEQSRDFTFVHNAVHANVLAARCDRPIAGEVDDLDKVRGPVAAARRGGHVQGRVRTQSNRVGVGRRPSRRRRGDVGDLKGIGVDLAADESSEAAQAQHDGHCPAAMTTRIFPGAAFHMHLPRCLDSLLVIRHSQATAKLVLSEDSYHFIVGARPSSNETTGS